MAPAKVKHPCLICKENVGNEAGTDGVQCCICDLWVHAMKCAKLSKEVYQYIKGEASHHGGASWRCDACISFASKVNARMTAVEKDVEGVKVKQGEHDKQIADLKQEVEDLKAARTADKAKVAETQQEVKTSVFHELREREQRSNSVVIRGLPEPAAANEQAGLEADMAKVNELIAALELQMEATAVRSTKRLGTIGDANDANHKPRQILVSFKDPIDQENVLKSSSKLAKLAPWKSVYVSRDLTKWQRQEEQGLLQQAKEMTEALGEDDAKNWEFRRVGQPGNRRIAKVPIRSEGNQAPGNPAVSSAGTDGSDDNSSPQRRRSNRQRGQNRAENRGRNNYRRR